ncbi:MAG: CCA tRNA nucleotidyltransferase [Candidatus Bathyarchaeota archaeon]|nr:CCA tRNA nucleotidyltransferase [Candidatus Bathyarchaeota archaeon]
MELEALTQQVLDRITPKIEEYRKVDALSKKLTAQIQAAAQAEGVTATVRVEGSVAKDTWLSENPDIDIFLRLPTSIPRKNLGEVGLKIARAAAQDAEQLERFAEHPYLEIFQDGYRVDIVPCYDAKPGQWQSATDRTPYHTNYIQTHLSPELHGQVRLLKRFMQGVGVYGAEIKVGGFSGYLCELLVMKYGSFRGVVEAFAHYSRRVIVDIEGHYSQRAGELELLFPEPLVIVDPVDAGRNVASAVQSQKLYEFIAASRAFLSAPSIEFFYPPPTHALAPNIVESHLSGENTSHLYLAIGELEAVPDVLWGQLYRTKRALKRLLETNDFQVLRSEAWSNEKSFSIIVFELAQSHLPNVKKHLGPQLERVAECDRFLSKYVGDQKVIAGPYVEDGRWIVEVPRKYTDAAALLAEKLVGGGKEAGVADLVTGALSQGGNVLVDRGILKLYTEHSDFAVFLTEFLVGKPSWLKAH